MPEMDGWQAAEKLKSNKSTSSIPLFALTAYTLPGERQRAMQAGFDGYVTKPIHVQGLLDMIREAFEKINNRSQ